MENGDNMPVVLTSSEEQLVTEMGIMTPNILEAARAQATVLYKSGLLPKHYMDSGKNAVEAIVVALQYGHTIGLKGLQALQGIAVINGKPTLGGDAALGLIRNSGKIAKFKESYEGEEYTDKWMHVIEVSRTEDPESVTRFTFSVMDAKRASLWIDEAKAKSNWKLQKQPWFAYPKRMLRYRNLGFVCRDVFPDVMQGLVTTEEWRDVEPTHADILTPTGEEVKLKLKSDAGGKNAVDKALEMVNKNVEEGDSEIGKMEMPLWNLDYEIYSEDYLKDLTLKNIEDMVDMRGLSGFIDPKLRKSNAKLRAIILRHQEAMAPKIEGVSTEEMNQMIQDSVQGGELVDDNQPLDELVLEINELNIDWSNVTDRSISDLTTIWNFLKGKSISESVYNTCAEAMDGPDFSYDTMKTKETFCRTSNKENLDRLVRYAEEL
jgi:hypothetical protein